MKTSVSRFAAARKAVASPLRPQIDDVTVTVVAIADYGGFFTFSAQMRSLISARPNAHKHRAPATTMPNAAPTIAIVGGGAIGAALLGVLVARLSSRRWSRGAPRVVLFEKSSRVGRGVAYAKDPSPYLLNTSAQAMSLSTGGPRFFEWLAQRGLTVVGGGEPHQDVVCSRETFGEYAEQCVEATLAHAQHRGIGVRVVHDEVTALATRAGGHRIFTRAHGHVDADACVLALGNLPSRKFAALQGPRFFTSPYPSDAFISRIPRRARVAILGTGLSAIDAALALFAAGHEAPVTMASRSGMLPAVRGPLPRFELSHVTRANITRATDHGRRPLRWATILRWLELELADRGESISWERDFPAWRDAKTHLRDQIEAAETRTRLWQCVGEALNPIIDVLWHHLAEEDRSLFLDHFSSRFMSHWVPIPLVTAQRVRALVDADMLHVERGFSSAKRDGDSFSLLAGDRRAQFDFVINATGAPRHVHETESPLLHVLLEQGTLSAHPRGGVRADFESLRVMDVHGRINPMLYAIGNLTCGTHLFTSTLDQNIEKAERLAARLVGDLYRRKEQEPHVVASSHSS
jgi:uncharacterized NAD(P)/FAD-binding protein YdhS